MNRYVKSALFRVASVTGLLSMRRWQTRSQFRIITYHGVDERAHPIMNYDRLQADPATFTRQVELLARAFRIVDLGAAVKNYLSSGRWPTRGLAISFDDGYLNNLEIAAPILSRIGVPATFFVTAGFVERRATPWWYDVRQWLVENRSASPADAVMEAVRLEAAMRPMSTARRDAALAGLGVARSRDEFYPFMTRDNCMALISKGFDVQCHGDSHASFGGESTDRVVDEIRKSVSFIEGLGHQPWGLAYPYGHEPADLPKASDEMKSHGLLAAFTTREGVNRIDENPWRLRRWDMHGGYDPLGALARIS